MITVNKSRICLAAILFSLIVFVSELYAQAPFTVWEAQHPAPQGNTLRAVKMFDSAHYIACGDFGTVISTTDDGARWDVKTRINGFRFPLSGIDFSGQKNGVVVGNSGRIMYTNDSGSTWKNTTSGVSVAFNDVVFVTPSRVCAVGNNAALLFSNDTGKTWTRVSLETQEDLKGVVFTTPANGYVLATNGYILFTQDSGKSWSFREYDFANNLFRLSFAPNDVNVAMCGELGGIFLSKDTAQSFTQHLPPLLPRNINDIVYLSSTRIVAVGDGHTIYVSDNAGTSFENVGGRGTDNLRGLDFVSENVGVVVGNNGIILRTSDGGMTWNTVFDRVNDDQVALFGVHDLDDNLGYACGYAGVIVKTTDAGSTWTALKSNVLNDLRAINFPTLQIGYATGDSGIVLKTTNGGTNWVRISPSTGEQLNTISFFDAETGVVAGLNGTVFITTTGGTTWLKIDRPELADFSSSAFLTKTNVLLGGQRFIAEDNDTLIAIVHRSTDGGFNFAEHVLPRTPAGTNGAALSSLSFSTVQDGYAAGWMITHSDPDGTVWRTTDGGITWSPKSVGVSQLLGIASKRPNFATAVGMNGVSFHTRNGNDAWEPVETGTSVNLYGVSHGSLTTAHAVGVKTLILKLSTNDKDSTFSNVEEQLAVSYTEPIIRSYPNPSEGVTTFSIRQEASSLVSLAIFTTKGEKLEDIYIGFLPEGKHTIGWDAGNYAKGIYFAVLDADGKREMIKVVVVK